MDGMDTIRSHHIRFGNWKVYSSDDNFSFRADSTYITVWNSRLYTGLGIAIGSIGQYYGRFETVERISVENVCFKTWTVEQNKYPPNGGGGGYGYAKNSYFKNLTVKDLTGAAVSIGQCTHFNGAPGASNCTSSLFQLLDITVEDFHRTTTSPRVGSFQCSAVKSCTNIGLLDIDFEFDNGTVAPDYLCGHVAEPRGWNRTGSVCEKSSAIGEC
ncbi:putative Alpha-L-rhamnosidase rgxB 1 [Seiridium cardinale]|uniref:Alpha-L-rhamnosidase rgxB 1 n=1 Tax=Seiridium cardinale TaxID=138064 RepID=A0ABR2XVH2_9PEZI